MNLLKSQNQKISVKMVMHQVSEFLPSQTINSAKIHLRRALVKTINLARSHLKKVLIKITNLARNHLKRASAKTINLARSHLKRVLIKTINSKNLICINLKLALMENFMVIINYCLKRIQMKFF